MVLGRSPGNVRGPQTMVIMGICLFLRVRFEPAHRCGESRGAWYVDPKTTGGKGGGTKGSNRFHETRDIKTIDGDTIVVRLKDNTRKGQESQRLAVVLRENKKGNTLQQTQIDIKAFNATRSKHWSGRKRWWRSSPMAPSPRRNKQRRPSRKTEGPRHRESQGQEDCDEGRRGRAR